MMGRHFFATAIASLTSRPETQTSVVGGKLRLKTERTSRTLTHQQSGSDMLLQWCLLGVLLPNSELEHFPLAVTPAQRKKTSV
jgi:hypothetical protein